MNIKGKSDNDLLNILNSINITSKKIGVMIPTTSKGHSWKTVEETFLYDKTIKSFINTTNNFHTVVFYIGIDNDDKLWSLKDNHKKLKSLIENRASINFKFIYMNDIPKGHLTKMWNVLFDNAYNDGCDYFLQCGDDIIFITNGWLDDSIKILKNYNDLGVTGPLCNNARILTQTIVSRKHMDIFKLYFPRIIINWFCDDWINEVYKPDYFYPLLNHKCINAGGIPRYNIAAISCSSDNLSQSKMINDQRKIKELLVSKGIQEINKYIN